jgi:hypothetical protein
MDNCNEEHLAAMLNLMLYWQSQRELIILVVSKLILHEKHLPSFFVGL